MSTQSIPVEMNEKIFGLIDLVLNDGDLRSGLVIHYTQTNDDPTADPAPQFRESLGELTRPQLVDLFFETVISNDMFDAKRSIFFVDPKGISGYEIAALYAHLYGEKIQAEAGKLGNSFAKGDLKRHLSQVDEAITQGAGRVHAPLGSLVVEIDLNSISVRATNNGIPVVIKQGVLLNMREDLRGWIESKRPSDLEIDLDQGMSR